MQAANNFEIFICRSWFCTANWTLYRQRLSVQLDNVDNQIQLNKFHEVMETHLYSSSLGSTISSTHARGKIRKPGDEPV